MNNVSLNETAIFIINFIMISVLSIRLFCQQFLNLMRFQFGIKQGPRVTVSWDDLFNLWWLLVVEKRTSSSKLFILLSLRFYKLRNNTPHCFSSPCAWFLYFYGWFHFLLQFLHQLTDSGIWKFVFRCAKLFCVLFIVFLGRIALFI